MKELQQKLWESFQELESTWGMEREGKENATAQTVKRINDGETLLFEPNKAIECIITENDFLGQFDLGFSGNAIQRGYSLLHVTKK